MGSNVDLTFNAQKTEVVMFSQATNIKEKLPNRLEIGNHKVPFSFRAKYLGVTLDRKLT